MGVVVLLLGITMSESAIDSLQNGLGCLSFFLRSFVIF
jgi:hypothetical protein